MYPSQWRQSTWQPSNHSCTAQAQFDLKFLFTVHLTVYQVLVLRVRQLLLGMRIQLLLMVRLRRRCQHHFGFANGAVPH